MTGSGLIDISPPIGPGSPVWPGDVAYAQQTHWPMADASPVSVSHFTTTGHIGAHADAPAHFAPDGPPIGEVVLDAYLGPCQVINCRSDRPRSAALAASASSWRVLRSSPSPMHRARSGRRGQR